MINRLMHRLGALGMLSDPRKPLRKNFGRPVRKASRRGQKRGLNKVGHRNNKG